MEVTGQLIQVFWDVTLGCWINTVKLSHNIIKGTEYFVLLLTSVILTMEYAHHKESSNTAEYPMLQNKVLHTLMSLQLSLTAVPNVIVPSSSGSSSPRGVTTWEDMVHYTGTHFKILRNKQLCPTCCLGKNQISEGHLQRVSLFFQSQGVQKLRMVRA